MSRGLINFLLFLGWIAALAALIFRLMPGWLAFTIMGALIVIGTLANQRKPAPDQQASSSLPSSLETRQRGKAFGRKDSYDEIIRAIRQKADAARSDAERRLLETHIFEAYFYHQGGFDYYFAHVDDSRRWADVAGALMAIGRDDVNPTFRDAVALYTAFDQGSGEDATKAYLAQVRELDARFRAALPDLEGPLRQLANQI